MRSSDTGELPMVEHVKEQEAPNPRTATKTRGTPAFAFLEPLHESGRRTEAGEMTSSYWAPGIDYDIVDVPAPNFKEDPADRLALLELEDDD
jgi:hypothetical protein